MVNVLLLNASFEPLTMVPVRRALRLVIDGKAEIIEAESREVIRSASLSLPRPAIIRLVKFVHVPRRFRRQVTNTFLFARDDYRCQYCHRTQADLRSRECLTRDHLLPISRGGGNAWTNVVTACRRCNQRKGCRLPEEAATHLGSFWRETAVARDELQWFATGHRLTPTGSARGCGRTRGSSSPAPSSPSTPRPVAPTRRGRRAWGP